MIEVSTPDERCVAVSGPFPAGFEFLTAAGRLALATFQPVSLLAMNVENLPPQIQASSGDIGFASSLDGCPASGLIPSPDGLLVVDDTLAVMTATTCESLVFLNPQTGALRNVAVTTPAGFGALDFPELPAPGATENRVAASTQACVSPPVAIDSLGNALPAPFCAGATPSFFTGFTAGVAVAGGHLFVAMSTLVTSGATPNFYPGAILVYDFDPSVDPPTLTPNATTRAVFTSGFNPTHVTSFTAGSGREFILVTVSGSVGLKDDDPGTPEIEAGGLALTDAAIDVIDAVSLLRVATIPLGMAGLSFDRLAIDPTQRVAMTGSAVARNVLAIDLSPLDALTGTENPALVLDGSGGNPDARIFHAGDPFVIPALAGGAPAGSCAGFSVGVAFNQAGDKAFATDFCDGTLAILAVDLSGAPAVPVPNDSARFRLSSLQSVTAPVGADSLGLARALGSVRVRPGTPGVDYSGPDVFFSVGFPEGLLCGIRVDSP